MIVAQLDNLIARHTFQPPFLLVFCHFVLLDILARWRTVEFISTGILTSESDEEDQGGYTAHGGESDGGSVTREESGVRSLLFRLLCTWQMGEDPEMKLTSERPCFGKPGKRRYLHCFLKRTPIPFQ